MADLGDRSDQNSRQGGTGELPALSTFEIAPTFSADARNRLDAFRQEYELKNGATPILPYSSMLPKHIQDWLLGNDPQQYFDHLPDFMNEYFASTARDLASQGRLDDLSDPVIAVYMRNRGKMRGIA